MTEPYWQHKKENSIDLNPFTRPDHYLWQAVQKSLASRKPEPHYLELYAMCKSDNPYIRQVKNSPNLTTSTAAELICRDKACELQYCMSLQAIAAQNKKQAIDLKGCELQYKEMNNCIQVYIMRINKREEQLRRVIEGELLEDVIEQTPVEPVTVEAAITYM